MRQVISVSLNGRAYQLEDDAYAVLAGYLADAARALNQNPDKDEIVADLEQAIAEKCDRCLGPNKTVVVRVELARIVEEMGPVDDAPPAAGPSPAAHGAATAAPATPKRLYQISEGAIVSGVCNGIAAYLAVDVTIVRLAYIAFVLLTGGAAVLAYLVLMFVVPYASTKEEHAAARGLPFNARALVERAKRKAAEFANAGDWRASGRHFGTVWRDDWRRARVAWRSEWRRAHANWRARPRPPVPPSPPAPYAAHVVTGCLLAVLGVVLALFTVGWLLALGSLVTTGAIFGWWLPSELPFWVGLMVLIALYTLVVWPIKAARRAAYLPGGGYHGPWIAAWDGAVGIAIVLGLAWYGYHHVPEVRDFIDHLTGAFDRTALKV